MKLAEALIQKKDLEVEIANLQSRLLENVKVQEGTQPFEKPELTLDKIKNTLSQLEDITIKIHKTNNIIKADADNNINELISKRDIVKLRHKVYSAAYKELFTRDRYATRSDIKYTVTADINNLLKYISDAAKEFRVLDTKIQSINWSTDLL